MKSRSIKTLTCLFLLFFSIVVEKSSAKDCQTSFLRKNKNYYTELPVQKSPYRFKNSAKKSIRENFFIKPHFLGYSEWQLIKKSIKKASLKYKVSEKLVYSLIKKESGFNPRAISRSGAMGLTQLMPKTAKYECGLSKSELFKVSSNINCGVFYLSKQIRSFGRTDLALAAYNAGPGAVKRAIEQTNSRNIHLVTSVLKAETKPYVSNILAYSSN